MRSKSRWTIGGVTLMALILILTLGLGIIPTANSISQLSSTIAAAEHSNLIQRQYLTTLRHRALAKDRFYIAVENQRATVPDSIQVVEYLNTIDTLANHAGVEVINFSAGQLETYVVPASITKSANYAAAAAGLSASHLSDAKTTITITGTATGINRFVGMLESNPRFMLVEDMAMQAADSSGKANSTMTATLNGKIFTYQEK